MDSVRGREASLRPARRVRRPAPALETDQAASPTCDSSGCGRTNQDLPGSVRLLGARAKPGPRPRSAYEARDPSSRNHRTDATLIVITACRGCSEVEARYGLSAFPMSGAS